MHRISWPNRITLADIHEGPMRRGAGRFGFEGWMLLSGDGTVPVKDRAFDAVWCNSVIEHVTVPRSELPGMSDREFLDRSEATQARFAREIARIASGYFELLDGAGRTVAPPGQRGEIVATGFINQVVPFVRYRSGDTAEYVADRCPRCGRYGPILRDIRGHRTQEVLIAADGSAIAWTALNMHDETFLHVRRFQFVQDTPGRARLRLVPAGGFREEDIHRIRRNLQRKLDGRLDLDMEICDSIGVSPQGKAIYVDQRIAGRAAAGESAASSEREPWAGTT